MLFFLYIAVLLIINFYKMKQFKLKKPLTAVVARGKHAITMALSILTFSTWAQTTVHFKPGASIGEDALLWELDNGCVPTGWTATPAAMNFGNSSTNDISAWTWSSFGCNTGTQRSIIRFSQLLSQVPSTATIINATLVLKTPQIQFIGNSYYPGSPFPLTNLGWLKLVSPGSTNNWGENTITWNSSQNLLFNPATVTIPVSTAQYNTTTNLNVTNMVQSIINDASIYGSLANNGFLLELQTEVHYRQQLWASSDYADSAYWPELIVTYSVCDASFEYCSSSDNPNAFHFQANTPNASYSWSINGSIVGYSPTLNYTFQNPGTYKVCLAVDNRYSKCEECIDLCVSNRAPKELPLDTNNRIMSNEPIPLQGIVVPGDDINKIIQKPLISPNPTNSGWNIELNENVSGKINITLYGNDGRQLKSFTKKLNKENRLYLGAEDLKSGDRKSVV